MYNAILMKQQCNWAVIKQAERLPMDTVEVEHAMHIQKDEIGLAVRSVRIAWPLPVMIAQFSELPHSN